MDQSTAQTIQLIDMDDKTQRLIHVLKCVSKGLSDINTAVNIAINALGNVSTITQELQRQIQDAVEGFGSVEQARPQASGQSLNSYLSHTGNAGDPSLLERSHQDQAQISSKSNHFKKSTQNNKLFYHQTNKSNTEQIKIPYYPKSEFDRVSSRDVGQSLSQGDKILSANQTHIHSFDEKTYEQPKSQQFRPHVYSFQKNQTDHLLKSLSFQNKKDTKIYGPLQAAKQYPLKLLSLTLGDIIYERESLPKGQFAVEVRDFISFAEPILEQMNATNGLLSTEIEIVSYIQLEASRLSNQTQQKDNRLRLSELRSRFQRFLKNRFNKTN